MTLAGCGTALITPFSADGSVDSAALAHHVDWQIRSGIRLLVPCGTTGEASTLSGDEWLQVIRTTVTAAEGRVPVFAGCTSNSTREACAMAARAATVEGLSGLLSANPYYSKPSQAGQFAHFQAIAEASPLPVMLYNIPGRTAANLEPATVARLAEVPGIVAIKESSGNLAQITETIHLVPRTFAVFAGDDTLALPTLAVGGAGLVSVASNAVPQQIAHMIDSALEGNWTAARRINRRFFHLMQLHFAEPSPGPIKAVLALLGRGDDHLRLPMTPVTPALRHRLESTLAELGLLSDRPASAGGGNLRVF